VPREWTGETVYILGGARSLALDLVPRLRGRGRVVAVNDAGLALAPWADVLFFADERWLEWNRGELHRFAGGRIVKRCRPQLPTAETIHVVERARREVALSTDPGAVAGFCSGGAALNYAALAGAGRVVLLGFAMRAEGHWHDRHRRPSPAEAYAGKMRPAIERMAGPLAAAGIEVLNATPGSALPCFPIVDPREVIPA